MKLDITQNTTLDILLDRMETGYFSLDIILDILETGYILFGLFLDIPWIYSGYILDILPDI